MEEINRKLLKMEETVLRSAFLHARCFPPGALLTPSGSPPPKMLQGWRIICFCLFIPWSLQWFLLAVVILFTPVSQVHLFAFSHSQFLPAAIWGADCLWLTPLLIAECCPYSEWSRLFFLRWVLRPGPDGLSSASWHCLPGSSLLSVLAMCSFSPTLRRVVLLTPASVLPRHLARHTSPGLWGPVPGHFSSLLSSTQAPTFVHTAALGVGSGSSYLVWLEDTYLFTCLIGGHLPDTYESAQDHLLCEAFLGYTTSPNSGEQGPSVSCASQRSSIQGSLWPVVFPPMVMPSDWPSSHPSFG